MPEGNPLAYITEKSKTRQDLVNAGVLLPDGTIDPIKAKPYLNELKVTGPGGKKKELRLARDFNDQINRQEFETARLTNKNAPFFRKSRSDARQSFLAGAGEEALNTFRNILTESEKPENISRNLFTDSDSPYFSERRNKAISRLDPAARTKGEFINREVREAGVEILGEQNTKPWGL